MVGVQRRQAHVDRLLEEAHGPEAPLGVAAHLGRRHLGVGQPRQLERDEPIDRGPTHSSRCQSFQALTQASPRSGSEHREKFDPQKPAMSDG